MLWTSCISRKIRKIHLGLICRWQFNFCFFSSFSHSLKSQFITSNIHSVLVFKLLEQKFLDAQIKVLSTEWRITITSFDFKNTSRNLKDRNIECSTTQIVHSNNFSIGFVQTKRQCSSCWLINDSLDLEICNFASILSCLSLRIIKIRRYCHNSLFDCISKICLRSLFHFHQNKGTDLLWWVVLALCLNPCISISSSDNFVWQVLQIFLSCLILESSSNQSFAREDCIFWISYGLSFGWDAD